MKEHYTASISKLHATNQGKKKAVSLCCLIELDFEFADKDEFVSYVGKWTKYHQWSNIT